MFVLIADNQTFFQTMLADILDEKQLPYQICETGAELLEVMVQREVSLFVVGMNMPDMDGASLCGQIRSILQDDCIPIIVLSSDESDQSFGEVFAAGATDIFRRSNIQYFSDYVTRLSDSNGPLEGRAMILEDSRSQRLILEEALIGWGMEVESFESPNPAYQAHLDNPFDVILTDIELRGLETGLDLVHSIRSQPFGIGDVPIIAITAYLSESTRVNFLARGIDRCMLKPILLPELRSELKNQLLSRDVRLTLDRARQQEKRAHKAQSNFVAKMSHELRTSLNAILGFSDLLVSNKAATKEITEYATKINDAGKHLLDMMNGVLNLSKIESGAVELNMQIIALDHILSDYTEQIAKLENKKNIRINIENQDQPFKVTCDKSRLLEVLLHLMTNAIKYNRNDGRVVVSSKRISADKIRINVADTGIGIESDNMASIFEPFASHQAEQGSGIGLPVAIRLMRLMGGDLGFSSQLGEGSDFWVDIPLAAEPKLIDKNGRPLEPLVSCRVIYIDDNPVNLLLVERWFKNKTHSTILIAESAKEGLALIREHKPDLVVSDINMPEDNGYWLLDEIRNDPSIASTPIIALSAMALCGERKMNNQHQFNGYIAKPVDFQLLTKTINKLLKNHS